jgi:hypothetical protein
MTHPFFRPLAVVGLVMGLALPAQALVPQGDVYTPEGAPPVVENWRNYEVERNDPATLWGICTNFLQQAGLTGQYSWRDCGGAVIGLPFNQGKINPSNGHLIAGTVIALPVHLTNGAPEPVASAAIRPSAADLAAFRTAVEAQVADSIAALAADLSAAEEATEADIAALRTQYEQLAAVVPTDGSLAEALAFVELLLTEGLSETMRLQVVTEVETALGTLPADVQALRDRLTTLENQRALPVGHALVAWANADAAAWYEQHPIRGAFVALAAIVLLSVIATVTASRVFGTLPFSFRARTTRTLDVYGEMLNGQDQRITEGEEGLKALSKRVDELTAEHTTTRKMVDANAGELRRVDQRVTDLGEVVSGVSFDAEALKSCVLKALAPNVHHDFHVESADGQQRWLLQLERVQGDMIVIHGVLRRSDSTELMPPVSASKVASAIRKAAMTGRLRGVAPQLTAVATAAE